MLLELYLGVDRLLLNSYQNWRLYKGGLGDEEGVCERQICCAFDVGVDAFLPHLGREELNEFRFFLGYLDSGTWICLFIL